MTDNIRSSFTVADTTATTDTTTITPKKVKSNVVFSAAISLFLFSVLNPVIANANTTEQYLKDAARQLGVSTVNTGTQQHVPRRYVQRAQQHAQQPRHRNTHRTSGRSNNPYILKQQQVQRQNLARKRARLHRLKQLQRVRLQRQNKARSQYVQRPQKQQRQHQGRQGNVWARVYQGFRFKNYNRNPLVKRYINQFSKNPARIERLSERASKHLFPIVNELNRRRMPTELALLPFVESAYRNKTFSHAGAAGMWQFTRSTGRMYGLKQTGSYDGRMDSFEATRAALDYLQKLNREFRGDWFLTLAAYNAGENRVHRAIAENQRRGLRTDYWSLRLPRETKQYVPRLLAFKEIFRNPRAFRVRLRGIPNTHALAQIRVNKPVNLRKAAASAGLPADTLTTLNPSYLHGITTPRFSNRIILPKQHAGRLTHAIQRLPAAADVHNKRARYAYSSPRKRYKRKSRSRSKRRGYITHKVRRGDNLYRIALKHGTTVKKIKRLNKMRNNKIWPGRRLKIATNKRRGKRRSS